MPRTFEDPITVAGIPFNQGPDADGVEWYCDELEGWEDTTEPNLETAKFGYSDGVAVGERAPLDPRFVEFGGAVVATTRAAADRAFRRLQSALDPNAYFVAERIGPIPERMTMRLAGKVYKPKDIGHAFRFATTIMAPWPYKLGTLQKQGTAGVFTSREYVRTYPRVYPLKYVADGVDTGTSIPTSIDLFNEGNANSYPIIRVFGPLAANSWYLVNDATGEQQRFTLAMGTGQTLTIDERRQVATLEGTVVDYFVRGDWLYLPPGITSTFRLVAPDDSDTAGFEVTAYDTWR
jgi:hypothetical protein